MYPKYLVNNQTANFTKIPNGLLTLDLTRNEMYMLLYFMSVGPDFNPSLTTICYQMRMDKRMVQRTIKGLMDKGMIDRVHTGNPLTQSSSIYSYMPLMRMLGISE